MKITDLRIGNYVLYPEYWKDKPIRVTGITVVDRRNDHTGIYEEYLSLLGNDFLTEDNFEAFVDYKNGVLTPDKAEPVIIPEDFFKNVLDDTDWIFEGFGTRQIYQHKTYGTIKLEYGGYNQIAFYFKDELIGFKSHVHQVQNLFHSLTGEELKFKL